MSTSHERTAALQTPFTPPPGNILLFVGQDQENIEAYLQAAHVIPAGFMSYTSIRKLEGIDKAFNQGDGTQYSQKVIDNYPNAALQIGLWMVDEAHHIVNGSLDSSIDHLGSWISRTNRPVYLRIGYEFDAPFNHYPPESYQQAFRYIVNRFRTRGIHNVAYVWHSYTADLKTKLDEWYPGDGYVDWCGVSYFRQSVDYFEPLVSFARTHHKPLMICESSPWKLPTKSSATWAKWFVPMFKFANDYDVKAICYINCDWNATRQFSHEQWGDTRLQQNADVMNKWNTETSQPKYLKSSPNLYQLIGFTDHSNASTKENFTV